MSFSPPLGGFIASATHENTAPLACVSPLAECSTIHAPVAVSSFFGVNPFLIRPFLFRLHCWFLAVGCPPVSLPCIRFLASAFSEVTSKPPAHPGRRDSHALIARGTSAVHASVPIGTSRVAQLATSISHFAMIRKWGFTIFKIFFCVNFCDFMAYFVNYTIW